MTKGFASWLKDHIVEIVSLAAGSGAFISIGTARVSALAEMDPKALIFISAATFSLGFAVGWVVHGLSGWSERRMEAQKAEIEEKKEEKKREYEKKVALEVEERKRIDSEREVASKIAMFSSRQLDLMLRVADAEDAEGFLTTRYGSTDDSIAKHLMACQVMIFQDGATSTGEYKWALFPNWSQFVRQNRQAVVDEISRRNEGNQERA